MFDVDQILKYETLYITEIEGRSFSWRLLTQREFKVFYALKTGSGLHPHLLHERVFQHCYLGNADFISTSVPAGITISIGETILWLSGECGIEQVKNDLAEVRKQYHATEINTLMQRRVLLAFPSYLPETVENWDRMKLLKRFVEAEAILVDKIPDYKPLDLRAIVPMGKGKRKNATIDFEKENRELRRSLGPQRSEDPNLSPERARKLDRLMRARQRGR